MLDMAGTREYKQLNCSYFSEIQNGRIYLANENLTRQSDSCIHQLSFVIDN